MDSEQSFNLNFVKEIRRYPALYNYKLIEDITENAWTDIGETVGLSVSECKERWKNLLAAYIRHKKQALNGAATRRPHYLEEPMEFILPLMKTSNSAARNGSASYDVLYNDQDEDNSSNQRQSPDPLVTGAASPSSPQQNHLNQPKKRPNEDKLDVQESYRSKISRVQDSIDTQREANTMFLLSLGPDLNDMSSRQVRTFRRKVLELIDEILATDTITGITTSTTNVKNEPLY